MPGCVCPDGLVADGEGGCIEAADCPCVHNEASYQAGQTIRVGCNTWCVGARVPWGGAGVRTSARHLTGRLGLRADPGSPLCLPQHL